MVSWPIPRLMPRIRTCESSGAPAGGLFTNEYSSRKIAALKPMPSASTRTIVRAEMGLRAT